MDTHTIHQIWQTIDQLPADLANLPDSDLVNCLIQELAHMSAIPPQAQDGLESYIADRLCLIRSLLLGY